MRSLSRPLFLASLLLVGAAFAADDKPDVGPNIAAQTVADALKSFAGSDGAFIAGGQLKATFDKDDLATMLQYPTDEVVVLGLTGDQIRQAFERSVSSYPGANLSFLQISGFEVTFKKAAGPTRVVSITANGAPLEASHTYTVAMPMNLAKGAVGYFRVWDDKHPSKTFPQTTIESVVKGKKLADGSPRWIVQG